MKHKQREATTYSAWRRGRRWGTSDDRRRCARISSWLRQLASSPRPAARSTAGLHHSDGRGTARDAQPPIPIAISHSRPTNTWRSTFYTLHPALLVQLPPFTPPPTAWSPLPTVSFSNSSPVATLPTLCDATTIQYSTTQHNNRIC